MIPWGLPHWPLSLSLKIIIKQRKRGLLFSINISFPIDSGPILIFVTAYKSKHNAKHKKQESGTRTHNNNNNNDTLNSSLNWDNSQVINPSVEGLFTFSDWVRSEYNNRQGVHTYIELNIIFQFNKVF